MRVEWLQSALDGLDEQFEYIAQDDAVAAARTVMLIFDAVDPLRRHPSLGRAGRVEGTRELVVTGTPYLVPYRIRAGRVEILQVMHSARKWPESFE